MTNDGALKYERIGCSSRPTCYAILNAKISVADGLHIEAEVAFSISEVFALLSENNANEGNNKNPNERRRRKNTHNLAAR